MKQKRWADLSLGAKLAVIVLGPLQVGLLAFTLWDIAHRSPEEVRGDRRMWAGLAFIDWIGPLAYFTYGRKEGLRELMKSCCSKDREDRLEMGRL